MNGNVSPQRIVGEIAAEIGPDVDGDGIASNGTTREIETLHEIEEGTVLES